MLKTKTKRVSVDTDCVIDGAVIAIFTMTVSTSADPVTSSRAILNQDKYLANMAEVNKDFQDFQSAMYAEQDKIFKEVTDTGGESSREAS